MARPAELSEEQIIEAGNILLSAGRVVTGFALRAQLGSGRANRLKQVWEHHQDSLRPPEAPAAELPIELADRIKALNTEIGDRFHVIAADLHQRAVRAAEARVGELVRNLDAQRSQADREVADAGETVDDIEAKLAEVQSQLDARTNELAVLQQTHQAQSIELSAATEKLSSSVRQIQALSDDLAAQRQAALDTAKLQGRVEELERQNAGLMAKLSAGH